jgi:hypothetical protein
MRRWLALGVILLVAVPTCASPQRIAVLMPEATGTWAMGARLGIEESQRTAELLRREVEIVEISQEPDAAALLQREARTGTIVIVSAVDAPGWARVEQAASSLDLVLMDARPRHQATQACTPSAFRVGLPDDTEGFERHALWHESLERYGAQQLNERFRRRFARGMDGAAWAGWFAVKVAAEVLLRLEQPTASSVAAYLTSPAAAFDGHKGQPLRFDPAHRHLAQPVYAIDDAGRAEQVDGAPPPCGPVAPPEPR